MNDKALTHGGYPTCGGRNRICAEVASGHAHEEDAWGREVIHLHRREWLQGETPPYVATVV